MNIYETLKEERIQDIQKLLSDIKISDAIIKNKNIEENSYLFRTIVIKNQIDLMKVVSNIAFMMEKKI